MASIASVRLRASSLLEAIVASVVFLSVFTISLETVVRLSAGGRDALVCAEADYRMGRVLEECRTGRYPEGITVLAFGWGTLTVRIAPYAPCPVLNEITLTAEIPGERKRTECKYLVGPPAANLSDDE